MMQSYLSMSKAEMAYRIFQLETIVDGFEEENRDMRVLLEECASIFKKIERLDCVDTQDLKILQTYQSVIDFIENV